MFSETKLLANSLFVTLVAGICVALGVLHLLVELLFDPPVAGIVVISTDGAVTSILLGVALWGIQCRRVVWLRLCALLITGLAGLALVRTQLPVAQQDFLELLDIQQRPPEALASLVAVFALWLGYRRPWAKPLWYGVGLVLLLASVSLLATQVLGDLSRLYPQSLSASFIIIGLMLLVGLAFIALPTHAEAAGAAQPLISGAIVLGMAGVTITAVLWYFLSFQHHEDQLAASERLLSSRAATLTRTVETEVFAIQRLASRWADAAESEVSPPQREDVSAYLSDMHSLQAIAAVTSDGAIAYLDAVGADSAAWAGVLQTPEVTDWLRSMPEQPEVRVQTVPAQELSVLLVATPTLLTGRVPGLMVGMYRFDTLLRQQIGEDITPYYVGAYLDNELLFRFVDVRAENQGQRFFGAQSVPLPGEDAVELRVYQLNVNAILQTPMMHLLVALLGVFASVALSTSITFSGQVRARNLALRQLLDRSKQTQNIQKSIVQDVPARQILRSVEQMVEREFSAASACIMLRDPVNNTLSPVPDSDGMDTVMRSALQAMPVRPDGFAGGAAADSGTAVITPDIRLAPHWQALQPLVEANGFRACWSFPAIARSGEVLGTLDLYHRDTVSPSASEMDLVQEACTLLSLSLEVTADRRALQDSEQRYSSLFSEHPDIVFSLDSDGRVLSMNAAGQRLLGINTDQYQGVHYEQFMPLSDQAANAEHFAGALAGISQRYEARSVTAQGEPQQFDITQLPMVVEGEAVGVFSILKNITARKQAEAQLQLLRRGVDASNNGIFIVDAKKPDMPIEFLNPAFQDITGYCLEESLGRNCRFLQGPDTDPIAIKKISQSIERSEEVQVTILNYRKDGSEFWNDLYVAPVDDEYGRVTHFVGVMKDISEQKRHEAELAYHASHDLLTGLPNRSLLVDRLNQDCQRVARHGGHVVVMFVDLDGFKPVNDSLGHALGDAVLVEVSRRLAEALRPEDTLARFGGDEFVAVLAGLRLPEEALPIIERLLAAVARPYRLNAAEISLTASVGLAHSDGTRDDPMTLVQEADMAMYKAKQQGRNHYQWYTSDINERVSVRLAVRNELQEALDLGQFALHYQPLLHRCGKRIKGFEALLRWDHPVRGQISPAQFISLSEETGQIIPISQWVIQQACADAVKLRNMGIQQFTIAVNVSPLHFQRPEFLPQLLQTLADHNLSHDALTLEITEGLLLQDPAAAIELLRTLHDAGIGVAIDDFGTGFSSLSYLKRLPVTELKIDRSFITDVTKGSEDAAITHSIIDMAHRLNLNVVAEGVETLDQLTWLQQEGCDFMQGFYFAQPMQFAAIQAYVDHLTYSRTAL